MHIRKTVSVIFVLCLSGAVLTACGRKGDLEVPGAAPLANQEKGGATKNKKQDAEDRPFILDPLL